MAEHPNDYQHRFAAYMERLVRLRTLLERDFHEDKITGLVVQPEYSGLFTDEEIDITRRRLDQLRYKWPDSST